MSNIVEVTRNEKYEYYDNGKESQVDEEFSEKYTRSTSASPYSPSKTVEKVHREHSSSVRVNGKSLSSFRPFLPLAPWRYYEYYDYYLPSSIKRRISWRLDSPKLNALL